MIDETIRFMMKCICRVRFLEYKNIYLERQRRAIQSTVSFIESELPQVNSVRTKKQLLELAFRRSNSKQKLILEFGVWKGQSVNWLAALAPDSPVYGFDSFEGLPEDAGGDNWRKGDFKMTNLPRVEPNVTLVKGWFNETIPLFLKEHSGDIRLLHIDSDLYSSARTIFTLLDKLIVPGTVIVFDEYFNYPGWEAGEHKAFCEWKNGRRIEYLGYIRDNEQLAVKIP